MDEKLSKDISDFRLTQRQLQLVSTQKMQHDMLLRETKNALEELRKAKASTDVFKAVGRILIKSDLNDLKAQLSDEQESLDLKLKSLTKQESNLQQKVSAMQKGLASKLQAQAK